MEELRVVRREDQALVVATDSGDEFRLVVDSSVLAELRHLARQTSGVAKINPREIQALVRAGKSREEIAAKTGAEISDIERYEEPVLAERRFILTSAQSVPVRTSPSEQAEEQFGTVIAERLISLEAEATEWQSWRDEDAGWMIGLEFISHDVAHRAVWSFEHRKGLLAPLTPDAVSLSKQGDVGDRLIPKLRAVDSSSPIERFDSTAFEQEQSSHTVPAAQGDETAESLSEERASAQAPTTQKLSPGAEAALRAGHPSTGSIPIIRQEDEFARRREIDQRAIKSPQSELPDLGQTADLLDALRKRRGAREQVNPGSVSDVEEDSRSTPLRSLRSVPAPLSDGSAHEESQGLGETQEHPTLNIPEEDLVVEQPEKTNESSKRPKGRASIPSWDDILFGTRSEEDPS